MANPPLPVRSSTDPAPKTGAAKPTTTALTHHDQLTGPLKAMLLLVSMDEDVATRVIAHFDDQDLEVLRKASESAVEVPTTSITVVQREFLSRVRSGLPANLKGSDRYLEKLVRNALGEGRAAQLFPPKDEIDVSSDGPAYRRLPPAILSRLLEKEHPQTIAVVLSQLDPERAAEAIVELPDELRADVLSRVGHLEFVPEQILGEIDAEFRGHLSSMKNDSRRKVDGKDAAAAILKRLGQDTSQQLLEFMSANDAPMAERLQQSLFTFADLIRMDARGMQQLLKEVPTDQLVLALKTSSEELREKIFASLSSRAAEMLREDLALLGPTKIADVEAAQRSIVETALNLERDGRVTIARDGGGDYV